MITKLSQLIFSQDESQTRVYLLRYLLALVLIVLVWSWPEGKFWSEYFRVIKPQNWAVDFFFTQESSYYNLLRIIFYVLIVVWAYIYPTRWLGLVVSIIFTLLHFLNSTVVPEIWNYNTHLIFFLFGLALCGKSPSREWSSFIIFYFKLVVCLVYFGSALSKMIHGGVEWVITGRTLQQYTALIGTDIGKFLVTYKPIVVLLSFITLAFETLFLLVLLPYKTVVKILILLAILFHCGVYICMGISFWHLWVLFPILFLNIPTKLIRE